MKLRYKEDEHGHKACISCSAGRLNACGTNCPYFTGFMPSEIKDVYDTGRTWTGKLSYQKYGLNVNQREQLRYGIQGNCCGVCSTKNVQLRLDTTGIYKRKRARGYVCAACSYRLQGLEDAGWQVKAKAYLDDPPIHRLRLQG